MTTMFFYGTLCHAPLLRLVLGRTPDVVAARLSGHAVHWAEGQSFPLIVEAPGVAEGIVVRDLTAEDRARLDFYEGAFAYRLLPVLVDTDAGPVAAEVYFPDAGHWAPGAPWSLADWVAGWGTLTLEAAAEVMAAYGKQAADDVAARFGMIRARAASRLRSAEWARGRSISAPFGREDVEVETLDQPYLGFFTVEEYRLRHSLFDGGRSGPVGRAVFRAADAVTVLPYDPVRDRVLLIEQVRVGAYAHGDAHPWLLEPIAGIIDAGETAEDTARREALEEAGVAIGALHFAGRYYPSPGGLAQVLISYLGIADLPDDLPGIGGLDAEGEDIRSHVVDFAQAMAMLESGELAVAPLIITVQWLAANRERLRAGG